MGLLIEGWAGPRLGQTRGPIASLPPLPLLWDLFSLSQPEGWWRPHFRTEAVLRVHLGLGRRGAGGSGRQRLPFGQESGITETLVLACTVTQSPQTSHGYGAAQVPPGPHLTCTSPLSACPKAPWGSHRIHFSNWGVDLGTTWVSALGVPDSSPSAQSLWLCT